MGRFIGGEAGHRSFFGGNRGGPRTVGLLVMAGIGVFVMMFNGVPGLITGVAGCLLVYLVTMGTHRGSVLQRWVKRRRWNHRKSSGTDVFVPYTGLAMDEAKNRAGAAGTKNARNRILNAVRSRPDGADGMGWPAGAAGSGAAAPSASGAGASAGAASVAGGAAAVGVMALKKGADAAESGAHMSADAMDANASDMPDARPGDDD